MIRRLATVVAALALVAGGLAACGDDDGEYYNSGCVSPTTHIRLDYSYCAANPSWVYYFPAGVSAPPVGSAVTGYSRSGFKRPSGATIKTNGIPKTGGKVPLIKTGPGVKVYKPAGGGGGIKPGGGYKAPPPARPPVRVGK